MMKISEETVKYFKNFASINKSLYVKGGNIIETVSESDSLMSQAKIPDDLKTFAIRDLNRFINTLGLFSNPEIIVQYNNETKLPESLKIIGDSGSVTYFCCDVDSVKYPKKSPKTFEPDVSFTLAEDDYNKILKAMSILGLPEFAFKGEGGKIFVTASNSKNPTSDSMRIEVGETEENKEFEFIIKSENLKMLPKTYDVSINANGLTMFEGDTVTYWVANENNSYYRA